MSHLYRLLFNKPSKHPKGVGEGEASLLVLHELAHVHSSAASASTGSICLSVLTIERTPLPPRQHCLGYIKQIVVKGKTSHVPRP